MAASEITLLVKKTETSHFLSKSQFRLLAHERSYFCYMLKKVQIFAKMGAESP